MTRLTLNSAFLKEKELRKERAPLLEAWDIFKTNKLIGIDKINDLRMRQLIAWYEQILDLNEHAIFNPPDEITKYVSKKGG